MALTTEAIHQAADKLHADGITPTQTKVREALGGGSFSTIGEALKTWKQELQEHEQLKRSDMPDNLRDEGIVFIAKLWQEADTIANTNLSAEREALAIDRARAQSEIDDLNEAITALETEQLETLNLLKLSENKEQNATSEAAAYATEIVSLNTFLTDLKHKLELEQERTSNHVADIKRLNNDLSESKKAHQVTIEQLTKLIESNESRK